MPEDEESETIAQVHDQFVEHCKTLNGLPLKNQDEWLGQRKGDSVHAKRKSKATELFDPEIGFKVQHRKEIQYINKTTSENLAEEITRGLQSELK